jgi:hypothetical protein
VFGLFARGEDAGRENIIFRYFVSQAEALIEGASGRTCGNMSVTMIYLVVDSSMKNVDCDTNIDCDTAGTLFSALLRCVMWCLVY